MFRADFSWKNIEKKSILISFSSPPPPRPHTTYQHHFFLLNEWFYKVNYEDQMCLSWPDQSACHFFVNRLMGTVILLVKNCRWGRKKRAAFCTQKSIKKFQTILFQMSIKKHETLNWRILFRKGSIRGGLRGSRRRKPPPLSGIRPPADPKGPPFVLFWYIHFCWRTVKTF